MAEVSEVTIDPGSTESVLALHATEKEHPRSVLRLIGYRADEPDFHVDDARLPQLDRLCLLVTNGAPFDMLEPHQVEDAEEPKVVEEVAANTPRRKAHREHPPNGGSSEQQKGEPPETI